MNLRIPGPTPCPDEVLQAGALQMINHRGPEFSAVLRRVTEGLNWMFQTSSDVYSLSTSGTGGLEAAIVNVLSPGDQVLAVSIGSFGDRFASIAQTYGAVVEKYATEWGDAADPAEIERRLEANPNTKAVLITHNETSTGVTNDIETIAKIVRKHDCLMVVDAVSSMSSIPCPVERWDLDVVVSGSQKGWMVAPGLAFVYMSERAWKAFDEAKMPRFYFDLNRARTYLKDGQNPWTPAMAVYFQMDKSLELLRAEGLEGIFSRHAEIGKYARQRLQALGLKLVPTDLARASDTVTAVWWPDGVDGEALATRAREEFGVVLAEGQGKLNGKIFRIGHLGYVSMDDVVQAIDVVEKLLAEARATV